MDSSTNLKPKRIGKGEKGFTLMETAIALVMMFVVSMGAASLFAYASNANSNADDRELANAIAQKRFEWLRTIPFNTQTRQLAYSYPNGGLAATGTGGVVETVTNAGRSYRVNTVIQDVSSPRFSDKCSSFLTNARVTCDLAAKCAATVSMDLASSISFVFRE